MQKTSQDIDKLLKKAWETRKLFFPDQIEFSAPNRTLSVSVTGSSCALSCAHCNGVYLQKMATLETALASKKGREKSYLVSGGSDSRGKVPLLEKWAELEELAARGPLNLHTGLVTEEEARRLAQIATVVSFDFMGDNETINRVYGLSATVEDYLASYRHLQKYVSVIPHICVGLNGGVVRGEYEALKYLQREAVEAISMIIFRPTVGTAFEDCEAPPVDEVAGFMATARLMFPRVPLFLGCMRPSGRYREAVDTYALKSGFNKIVLPAPAARLKAEELGLEVSISEECCSL